MLLALVALMPLVGGCSAASRVLNCSTICDRYEQCIDSELDTGQCVKTCERKGAEDQSFAQKAEACKQCLAGRSCVGASACVLDCVPVIISST